MKIEKKTMKSRVYNYMKECGSISSWEAIKELGCTRLSEYIRQLRQEYKVNDEWIDTTNRFGDIVRYKKYFLDNTF